MNLGLEADPASRKLSVAISDGFPSLSSVVCHVERSGAAINEVALRRSTLDDVFLALTGQIPTDESFKSDAADPAPGTLKNGAPE